jgi:hypothetical protein
MKGRKKGRSEKRRRMVEHHPMWASPPDRPLFIPPFCIFFLLSSKNRTELQILELALNTELFVSSGLKKKKQAEEHDELIILGSQIRKEYFHHTKSLHKGPPLRDFLLKQTNQTNTLRLSTPLTCT